MKNHWAIHLTKSQTYMVPVHCETEEEAVKIALSEMVKDADYHNISSVTYVSGILINDTESRGFAPYVPDFAPRETK